MGPSGVMAALIAGGWSLRVRPEGGEAKDFRPLIPCSFQQKGPDFRGSPGLWRVRDSNPRRLRRLIYSQIPLAAWVTRQIRGAARSAVNDTGAVAGLRTGTTGGVPRFAR